MSDVFSGFIQFGRETMQGVRANDPDAIRYKWLLGEINEIFAKTHSIVVKKLEAIEAAQSVDGACALIKELRGQALSNSFHAQGLCDAFVGLGNALSSLNWRVSNQNRPASPSLAHASDLAQRLQQREFEVAQIYGDEIRQLSALLDSDAGGSLQQIKDNARSVKRELIAQMGDFSQLAKGFKTVGVG